MNDILKCEICGGELTISDGVCPNGYSVDYYTSCHNCGFIRVANSQDKETVINELRTPITVEQAKKAIVNLDEQIAELISSKQYLQKFVDKNTIVVPS